MKMDSIRPVSAKHMFLQSAKFTLSAHRCVLKGRVFATDMAVNALAKLTEKEKRNVLAQNTVNVEKAEKETTDMKGLIKGIVAIAAVGAALGAGYAYYKKNKVSDQDYEELIFTDDGVEEVEYVEVETKMDKVAQVAEDVKDVVKSAAEDVADTVADAFYDVKEAINSAIED